MDADSGSGAPCRLRADGTPDAGVVERQQEGRARSPPHAEARPRIRRSSRPDWADVAPLLAEPERAPGRCPSRRLDVSVAPTRPRWRSALRDPSRTETITVAVELTAAIAKLSRRGTDWPSSCTTQPFSPIGSARSMAPARRALRRGGAECVPQGAGRRRRLHFRLSMDKYAPATTATVIERTRTAALGARRARMDAGQRRASSRPPGSASRSTRRRSSTWSSPRSCRPSATTPGH